MRDFQQNPFIVIWELTRACQLKCLHCRAEAQYHRDPRELTLEEGKKLTDDIYAMDQPLLVFTGGGPLMRPDVYDIAKYAIDKGLRVSMTPSATPNVTKDAIRKAKEVGLARWAFSLDGPTAEMRQGADRTALKQLIVDTWNKRTDRYSDERTEQTAKMRKKIEMSYIGG